MMYGGSGCGYGGAGVFVLAEQERPSRHYPLDVLQVLGGATPAPANTRRAPRKERQPRDPRDATAFGYDSDDSSLSSNASGSNKSGEKGMFTPTYYTTYTLSSSNTSSSVKHFFIPDMRLCVFMLINDR